MRYVLDSSAAVQWVLPEKDSAKAIRLRDDYHNAIHELLAPDIFPAEMLNALTKAERTKRIGVGDARILFQSILADTPVLHPYLPLLNRAGEVASRFRLALYDCLYLALAEREACELVTADTRFLNNLRSHFPFLVDLASLP
ncbi:MAG: type II toxin-antitoxin system VapC family toxin [Gemmataceae bacterium]